MTQAQFEQKGMELWSAAVLSTGIKEADSMLAEFERRFSPKAMAAPVPNNVRTTEDLARCLGVVQEKLRVAELELGRVAADRDYCVELIRALDARIHSGYDWNGDPDAMTRKVGDVLGGKFERKPKDIPRNEEC